MATGQNPNDPLTVLNGPMGHGLMAGFNPFQGMGVNFNDPNMVRLLRQNTSVVSNSWITGLT
jgi:ubiquilin